MSRWPVSSEQHIAGVEQAQDGSAVLDRGADVRMKGQQQAAVARDLLQPVEIGQQYRPLVISHSHLAVIAAVGGLRRQHDDLGPRGGQGVDRVDGLSEIQPRINMQWDRQEAAD